MRKKSKFLKKLLLTLFSIIVSITPLQAGVSTPKNLGEYDLANDTIILEKNISSKDVEFMKKRNMLIKKYGVNKAYKILGYVPVEERVINIQDRLREQRSIPITPIIVTATKTVTKGTMKVTMYKNPQNNYMDIWGEMSFSSGKTSGLLGFQDLIALSYDDVQVCPIGAAYTSSVVNYHDDGKGGGEGKIKAGSTYARIVFTVKPSANNQNITECHGGTIMLYGQKKVPLPDNASVSVGGGFINVSSGGYYTLNYLEYSGW